MLSSTKPAAPSLFEITLGAVLSVVLGAVLAASYLAAQPVEQVRSLPKEPDESTVYYVTGSSRSSLGRQWLRKKQVLVEQGAFELEFNEDELNTWMSSSQAKPDGEEESGVFVAKGLNFRIDDGQLQLGLPCTFSLAGVTRDVVVQARGGFVRDGGAYAFKPAQLYVGTLDVARLPVVGDFFYDRLIAAQEIPEDVAAAWGSLSRVAVEGNVLKLERR
ncbi:hypothetical protein [Actomonas aquatica]|uniref:Uncharacterized protein n=1 Tax=Actomonas aquatica TaxID=2866162 RepID=A0ABZ1C7Y5_9BACT|nr:hypothetical protein [Opitutus sp. WL0086]WRQ87822.1 hypothetical protein K1X11_000270 [Opitutus sp. WL0086]